MEAGCFGGAVSRGGKKTKKTFADKKKVFTFADPNGKAGRGTVPGFFLGGCAERAAEKTSKKKLAGNQKVVTFATRFCRKEEKKIQDGEAVSWVPQGAGSSLKYCGKTNRIRDGAPRRRDGRTEQEWFKAIKNNLTMESLILAQDER